MIETSVIIPIYNEEESLPALFKRFEGVEALLDQEIILVNDGSKDNSEKIIKDYLSNPQRKLKKLRLISLAINQGQSIALACGIKNSKGNYVVMMDGDLQNFPEDVPAVVNKAKEGFQAVSGQRLNRKEGNSFRKFPSKVANKLIRKVTGCKVKDMGGMNCIQGDIARELIIKKGFHRIIPALVHMRGGRTTEIPVQHDKRMAGVSKYTTISRTIEVVFDIILLWFKSASKSRPIYIFGKISFVFGLLSALIFLFLVYERQFNGVDMGNRPLFIIDVIMFLTSLGVISVGIITELLSDLSLQNSEESYVVNFDSEK